MSVGFDLVSDWFTRISFFGATVTTNIPGLVIVYHDSHEENTFETFLVGTTARKTTTTTTTTTTNKQTKK